MGVRDFFDGASMIPNHPARVFPRIHVRECYRNADTRTRGSESGAGALAPASRARAGTRAGHAPYVLTMCAQFCNVVVYTDGSGSKWLERTRKT